MSLIDLLIGRPIATSEERGEEIGIVKGIPIFGLDALSSAAYGPEAALTLLIPLAVAGLSYILPLTLSIIALLIVVFFSYRQTIAAYPGGGGSYTVAHENLGTFAGLIAAAALMIDYVLTAAVGISAGIGALTSAIPSLHSKTLLLCLIALFVLTLVNLRGVQEAGAIFMGPTYLFLGSMFIALGIGCAKTLAAGGHPTPVIAPPAPTTAAAAVSLWLLLKAFASGCTAMTGVEAVSNGVRAFREPVAKTAQRTLAIIIACLVIMLAGIAFLVRAYKIVATDPNGDHYRSILSMLLEAVSGRNWFYYVTMCSILLVLIFSANTAFADFPRVCRAVAENRFLPISFAIRGRRLVYTEGIVVLAILTAALLITFDGVTDRLIPLYAVGAFLAFTLSQAGMVAHWLREGKRRSYIVINGLGAIATGITVVVVIVAKFVEGAWITAVAIPALLFAMYRVNRHYDHVGKEIGVGMKRPLNLREVGEPIVVVPLLQWSKLSERAMWRALCMSKTIKVVHVAEESETEDVRKNFQEFIADPLQSAGQPVPELVLLLSPYRFVVTPMVEYILKLSEQQPKTQIVAIVPELVERRWYGYFLHTQRSAVMKAQLLWKGNDRISVLNVPWYVE